MRTFDRVRVYAQFAALLPVSYEWLSGSLFVESMKRLAIDDADEFPELRAIHLRSIIRPAVRRRTWPSRRKTLGQTLPRRNRSTLSVV